MSPWWVQGLVSGLLFGIGMTVISGVRDGGWVSAAVGGAVGGTFFGLVMGVTMSKINRCMFGGLEGLSRTEVRTVLRASSRGPAPADPRLREAARALVHRQHDEMVRTWRRSIVTFVVALVLYVALALVQSSWWWLAAVVFLGFLIWLLTTPERLRRRLSVLSGDAVAGH